MWSDHPCTPALLTIRGVGPQPRAILQAPPQTSLVAATARLLRASTSPYPSDPTYGKTPVEGRTLGT